MPNRDHTEGCHETDKLAILAYEVQQTSRRVQQMHDAMFGIEGSGGFQKMVADHEAQIRALQNDKAKLAGIMVALSAISGIAGTFIGAAVKHNALK